jgi:hypothetical protein
MRSRRHDDPNVSIRLADGTVVVVHAFPEDVHVADDIRRAVHEVVTPSPDLDHLRQQLEDRLRAWYPRMIIRPRESLATLSQLEHVWYAMRDGRVHAPDARLDRLHAAMANARDVKEDADTAMARARELAGVAGRRRPSAPRNDEEADDEGVRD